MPTQQRTPPRLSDGQVRQLALRLAEQEQFRAQQVAQLSARDAAASSDAYEQIRLALLAGALAELADTQAAQRRLRDGTFGRCADCGAALDVALLEVLPHAPLCMSCEWAGLR
ncbi:hypothetical protein acdb102_02380 [Acidothermaceae bacterium B102]|nr:hypothetical protein acdb102_02380 [Acidothermaceae bacterium B102]